MRAYLSGRVSAVLALHRVFADGNRPVPGVIVFDQLSRPFYSPETNRDEVVVTAADRADLKQYFDALFNEVERRTRYKSLCWNTRISRTMCVTNRQYSGDGRIATG